MVINNVVLLESNNQSYYLSQRTVSSKIHVSLKALSINYVEHVSWGFNMVIRCPWKLTQPEYNYKYLTGCHLFKYTAILNRALVIKLLELNRTNWSAVSFAVPEKIQTVFPSLLERRTFTQAQLEVLKEYKDLKSIKRVQQDFRSLNLFV